MGDLGDYLAVALAGGACGLVNSIAGGGSLILFPVLLWVGLPSLDANVTNSVATWPGYLGGVGGIRTEKRDQRHRLPRHHITT
ncbi:MAG: TSUP family transporter, partial [Acidimicrobiales bacterium]